MFALRADTRAARIRASLVVMVLSGATYSGVQHLTPLLHPEIPPVPATILDELMPYSGWALIPYASLAAFLLTAAAQVEGGRFRHLLRAAITAQAFAYVIFLCWPMRVTRPPPGADAGTMDHLAWWLIDMSDLPFNTVPSLHVAYALIAALILPRWWSIAWAMVIALSVLPLRQHLVFDVVSGAVLGVIAWRISQSATSKAVPPAGGNSSTTGSPAPPDTTTIKPCADAGRSPDR